MKNTVKKNISSDIASSLLMLVLIVFICYTLQSVIVPILFSIIFSVLLYPLCRRLENKGMARSWASITSLILGVLVILGIGYLLVSQTINIGNNAADIASKIQGVADKLLDWLSDKLHVSSYELVSQGKEKLSDSMSDMGSYLTRTLSSIGNSLSSAILVPIMVFFFLYYRVFFRDFCFRAFSSTPKAVIEEGLEKIYFVLKSYLVGLVTVMGIVAVLNTIGLYILGIEYAWFFGILAALLTIFPYIGIFIGSIIPAFFALATKDSGWYAVGVIIWFQIVQTLEGNFITPNIVGGKVSLNPLVSLLSLFLGGMLFGLMGMILALPLLAMLKVIFDIIPQTQPYGFLLSEPDKAHLLTARQKKKAEKKKEENDGGE
ncbi:AI-2E family transporter [Sinomicrobium soli]|uniref:AI-2E family transporter n=1 Tax=Sinomicrobium sp. N-1-3-6 TaxID=2219864 RepID=UPI000DCAEE2F|nr:AI-2E family transporter [Sinomicrobium sp. N-1-3-6]RAV29414.1 AI-2E family transporter [Sinomicrobium sp. N-1-3-6]